MKKITLTLTEVEADVLEAVLGYQHLGEYDGGPLGSVDKRREAHNINAALRIAKKLRIARGEEP